MTVTSQSTSRSTDDRATDDRATEDRTAELSLPYVGDIERLVRARGAMFLVTDNKGDITPPGARELGLFHEDTRHLSHYELEVHGGQIVRLSAVTSSSAYNQIDLMLSEVGGEFLDDPKNFLHVRRRQILDLGLTEEIVFTNFLTRPITITARLRFGADYADIFEVRGAKRKKRGITRPPRVEGSAVTLAYTGLDDSEYTTRVAFSPPPSDLAADAATYELTIPTGEAVSIEVRVHAARDAQTRAPSPLPFERRADALEREAESFFAASTRLSCDDGRLQGFLTQSAADLFALRVKVGDHTILGAGIPWFCAPFGRDALLTSYEALTFNPDLAVESLRMLAAYQGKRYDEVSEEEPGKIFHELRFGEMARTHEIPHSPYYGSIDSTPLFVVVAHAAYEITGDAALLRELSPNLVAALAWIDARSDDGKRPVTYERSTALGLENQGWKDSRAGVSFPDGRRAEPPIALCEVQGYCIDAYARGSVALRAVGEIELAEKYAQRAETMRETFERAFWMPAARRYAYALDGHGRVLPTVVSNVGHLLWSRALSHEHAAATARLLLASPSFGGYGVRTLACDQPVYNPLSYHNGTVWPHDNAIIAKGFAQYDLGPEALKIFDGLYAAMAFFGDRRLPELFCGIGRRSGPLVRYPVAASPQAWAAATPFLLLQATLGIVPDAPNGRLIVRNPRLPSYVRRVELRGMRVGGALVSARFRRVGKRCHIDMLEVTGGPLKTEIVID